MEWLPQLLVLPCAVEGAQTKTLTSVVASVSGNYQQCGRSFHAKLNFGIEVPEEEIEEVEEESSETKELRLRLTRHGVDLEDYYALLALEEKRFTATEKEVQDRWKVAGMCCHPDKALPADRSKAELRYKALQKGVEVLTDAKKRMTYDSSFPFDDDIPNPLAGATPETFYEVYGPVFQENARFSINKNVPSLGSPDAKDKEVIKFYDFWLGFKSWREFVHKDEESVNDGTWREEKRRIERANAKLRAGEKKKEIARVQKLTEDAMKKDPRMQRIRQQEEQIKLDRKNAAKNKKNFAANEQKRKIEEAKEAEAKKAADEAEAKIQAKLKANIMKTLKKRLRKFGKAAVAGVEADVFMVGRTKALDADDVEYLSNTCEMDVLQSLVDQLMALSKGTTEEDKQASCKLLADELVRIKAEALAKEQEAADRIAAAKKAEELANMERPWNVDELKILLKALQKSSGGAKDWETITWTINQAKGDPSGKDRIMKEVKKKSKTDVPGALRTAENAEKKKADKAARLAEKAAAAEAEAAAAAVTSAPTTAPAAAAVAAPSTEQPAPAKKAVPKKKSRGKGARIALGATRK